MNPILEEGFTIQVDGGIFPKQMAAVPKISLQRSLQQNTEVQSGGMSLNESIISTLLQGCRTRVGLLRRLLDEDESGEDS